MGASREPWREARSFADVCELGAQFCEGRIEHINGYDRLTEDTYGLSELLAECNRAGFFTQDSQQGEKPSRTGAQRAYVCGYAKEPLAMRLYCMGLESDLVVLVVPAVEGDHRLHHITVTLDGKHPCTWCGAFGGCEDLRLMSEHISRAAALDLMDTYEIQIIDPRWGRSDYLWPRLREAIKGKKSRYSHLCSTGTANGVQEFIY